MPRSVFYKSQAWLTAAVVGLLTTTSIETVRAGDRGLSLANLAGSYAGSGSGFLTVCLNATGQPAACTDPYSVAVQLNHVEVPQGTLTADGKYCFTTTVVASHVGGSKAPAIVLHHIAGGSITSYDPRTGRGTSSDIVYDAADGVSCEGATVVNPHGAQPIVDETEDFTSGQEPARHVDLIFTSETAVDGHYGAFVLTETLYIQDK